jgi:hypothetical protein
MANVQIPFYMIIMQSRKMKSNKKKTLSWGIRNERNNVGKQTTSIIVIEMKAEIYTTHFLSMFGRVKHYDKGPPKNWFGLSFAELFLV